jgi:hypothetical protein
MLGPIKSVELEEGLLANAAGVAGPRAWEEVDDAAALRSAGAMLQVADAACYPLAHPSPGFLGSADSARNDGLHPAIELCLLRR